MNVVSILPTVNRPLPPKSRAVRPRDLPTTGGRRGEYALSDVARSLHLRHFEVRTIIAKLRQMAKDQRMPLPRTPRMVNGEEKRGPDSIYRHSRWDAGEFDAWLDSRHGGGGSAPTDSRLRPVPTPIRMEMAERARAAAGGR